MEIKLYKTPTKITQYVVSKWKVAQMYEKLYEFYETCFLKVKNHFLIIFNNKFWTIIFCMFKLLNWKRTSLITVFKPATKKISSEQGWKGNWNIFNGVCTSAKITPFSLIDNFTKFSLFFPQKKQKLNWIN